MLYFTRWKALGIILTALVVCLCAVPNFFPEATVKSWPLWAQRHIVLPVGEERSVGGEGVAGVVEDHSAEAVLFGDWKLQLEVEDELFGAADRVRGGGGHRRPRSRGAVHDAFANGGGDRAARDRERVERAVGSEGHAAVVASMVPRAPLPNLSAATAVSSDSMPVCTRRVVQGTGTFQGWKGGGRWALVGTPSANNIEWDRYVTH